MQNRPQSPAPITEKKTKGHGGKRGGAGRPKGSVKEEKNALHFLKTWPLGLNTTPQQLTWLVKQ